MKTSVKNKADPLRTVIMKGFITAILATLGGASACGLLIILEWIPEEAIEFCAIAVQFISVFLGTVFAKEKERCMLTGMLIGIFYAVVLVTATALAFGGQYRRIGISLIAILIGCILGIAWVNNMNTSRKVRRSKIRAR